MRKAITIAIVLLAVSFALAASIESKGPIRFFYSTGCRECTEMRAFIVDVLSLNPDLNIEMYCIDETQEEWVESCTNAGIPAWGVPRIFIGDTCFADFIHSDGELIYERSYYGYVGYCNQIVKAIEAYTGRGLVLPGVARTTHDAASPGSSCNFGCD